MKKYVLQWHITHKCNLRCSHCYQEDYQNDLDINELKTIINKYVDFLKTIHTYGHINITGGEPLVSNRLYSLLDLIEAEEQIKTFGILTNGTMITEEIANKLSKYDKLSFVQISIDGKKETHEKIRGKGTFDKSLEAIRFLNKYNIQTMVSFTVSRLNYNELGDVIKICRKNNVDRFWTDRIVPIGTESKIENNSKLLLTTDEFMRFSTKLNKEALKSHINPFYKTTVHNNRAMQFIGCSKYMQCGYKCSAGKGLIIILANGDVLPCRRINKVLGNILKDDLEDIIRNNNKFIKSIHQLPNQCIQCNKRNICNGGAKCLTYAVTHTFNNIDINCINNKGI